MSQIKDFERPYNVVYGEYGVDEKIVPGPEGPDFPLWKARRMLTALLKSQEEKATDVDEKETFFHIRRTFHMAAAGDLVFGKIARFKNKAGKGRFIGIVEKGQKHTEAGQSRQQRDPNYVPPKRTTTFPHSARDVDMDRLNRRTPPPAMPRRQSEAERIADKMAKASRKAAEGDGSGNHNTAP